MPGIAVAWEILRRDPESGILFVGADQGIERTVVPREGFALETLPIGGLKRVGWRRAFANGFAMVSALVRSIGTLSRFDPEVVVGLGGYASFPMVGAAILRRKPVVIMEQNVLPGLANRVLGRRADFVAVPDSRAARHFPGRAVVTGNPVRAGFKSIAPKEHRPPFTILVTGGSQGAEAINRAMIGAIEFLGGWKDRLQFVHHSGQRQEREIQQAYDGAGFSARVRGFFEDFAAEYAGADLIVARAGNTTVAELCAAGRAAILIPLPHSADDHQRQNARAMVEKGSAMMIDPDDLDAEVLARQIRTVLEAPERLSSMEENARRTAVLDAEVRIVDLIERAIAARKKK